LDKYLLSDNPIKSTKTIAELKSIFIPSLYAIN
jgi:hypothetical protein